MDVVFGGCIEVIEFFELCGDVFLYVVKYFGGWCGYEVGFVDVVGGGRVGSGV